MRRYDPGRPFPVWLRTIALNKCRDHGRRSKVRRLVLAAFAIEPKIPLLGDLSGRERDMARLDQAIARLPALYKDSLLLTTAGGLSSGEAAMVLGVTPKAIEMRLRRARQALAKLFSEDQEG
jgi:RNA polymerase sigma-70 factor (ECF subfamily)